MDKQSVDYWLKHGEKANNVVRVWQGEKQIWPPAQDANADADLLDTSSPLRTPVQEDYLTRLDRVLTSIEQRQARLESLLLQIIETLAEDEDPDDMPATYLDGSRV